MNKKSFGLPSRFIALAIIAALGMILSFVLTHQFYEVRGGVGGFKSICNLSQKMNCDAVAASPYAEFFGGTPLSTFGSAWFLATLIISLLSIGQAWRRVGSQALLIFFALGSGFSLFYFYVMAEVLHTFCLFCLFIDVLNFTGLGIALSLQPWKSPNRTFEFGKWKTLAGVTLGSLFVALVLSKGMDQSTLDPTMADQMVQAVLTTAPVEIHSGDEFPSIGPKSAPITIVEFSDFQCPYCRLGAIGLNSVLNRYPEKVRLVFRNFPLDPSCNPEIKHALHQVACDAARTVLCAHRQGQFKAAYESFFEHQANLALQGPGSPAELAKGEGIEVQGLASCVQSPEIASAISKDIQEGKRLGISSTPTFFVNGRKVEGIRPPLVWNQIIDALLATSSAARE